MKKYGKGREEKKRRVKLYSLYTTTLSTLITFSYIADIGEPILEKSEALQKKKKWLILDAWLIRTLSIKSISDYKYDYLYDHDRINWKMDQWKENEERG
ncbi:hypothetical protein ACH3XW_37425 [Acanthocheilonema viteae]